MEKNKILKSNKIKKIVIRLVSGLILIIYLTVGGAFLGSRTIKASSVTPQVRVTIMNNTSQLTNNLARVGMSSDFKDVEFIRFIMKAEKRFGLPPCELLALINTENSFTSGSTLENDGIMSYNCSQMRIGTAKIAYAKMLGKGINVKAPTEEILKNDRYYAVMITASYLQDLHQKYDNVDQVRTYYNCGEGNNYYGRTNWNYSYTQKVHERVVRYRAIIGNNY